MACRRELGSQGVKRESEREKESRERHAWNEGTGWKGKEETRDGLKGGMKEGEKEWDRKAGRPVMKEGRVSKE